MDASQLLTGLRQEDLKFMASPGNLVSSMWRFTSIILADWNWRQEDQEVRANQAI